MKRIGDFFFVLGMFVTVLSRMIAEDQTAKEALIELHKDIIFASTKGIERLENE